MLRFVDLLDVLCPLFKPYIEAHKCDRDNREKKGYVEAENNGCGTKRLEAAMTANSRLVSL